MKTKGMILINMKTGLILLLIIILLFFLYSSGYLDFSGLASIVSSSPSGSFSGGGGLG